MVAITIMVGMLLQGCGIPRQVAMDDPRVQPFLHAAESFDRTSHGFSPIPKQADVRLELRSTERYDAMLHINAKTSRTIAFRKDDDHYVWIGDQEAFRGPKKYDTEDGVQTEQIVLTYEIQRVSGDRLNQLNVDYLGRDPRVADRQGLTLDDVKPILKEWGY